MGLLLGLLVVVGRAIGGAQGRLPFGLIGVVFHLGARWLSDEISPRRRGAGCAGGEAVRRRVGDDVDARHGQSPALTAGILELLDARHLRAVLAHEMGHVVKRATPSPRWPPRSRAW